MKPPEFGIIYNFLYNTVKDTYIGQLVTVDQASLMDAAVRLYIYENNKYEKRLKEGDNDSK